MKDIIVERIEFYKCELEEIKENKLNKLNKTINECDKVIDIFAKNINNYSINEEYESFLILACKLEKIKNEINKLNSDINSLVEGLELFLKIYD